MANQITPMKLKLQAWAVVDKETNELVFIDWGADNKDEVQEHSEEWCEWEDNYKIIKVEIKQID